MDSLKFWKQAYLEIYRSRKTFTIGEIFYNGNKCVGAKNDVLATQINQRNGKIK